MTLFWHNHFATGYTKIAGDAGTDRGRALHGGQGVRGSGRVRGQIEMLRDNALGNFRDILLDDREGHGDAVLARRPDQHEGASRRRTSAARSWSCSRWASATTPSPTSTRRRACSPAGTCSGRASAADGTQHYEFVYNAGQHETTAKTFSFPIYPDGSKTIPARSAADGMQDGLDFIDGLAAQPEHGALSRRRSCIASSSPRSATVDADLRQPHRGGLPAEASGDMKAVMREILLSPEFWDPRRLLRALLVAGRVRRPRDQGRRLDRLLGQRRADAARRTWGRCCTSRRTSPAGTLGQVVVLDRRDARAHEFRVDARRRTRSSSSRRRPSRERARRPRRCSPVVARSRC